MPANVSDEDLGRSTHRPERWLSSHIWHRAHSPADEDLDGRRIYAPLDEEWSVDLMSRAEGGTNGSSSCS